MKVILKECMVEVTRLVCQTVALVGKAICDFVSGVNIKKYRKNCENPLYIEGFLMLYSRSCNVRKTAQIKSHVQRFRWMVPLRCEVGSG